MSSCRFLQKGHLWCRCLRPNSPHGIPCPLLYAGELRLRHLEIFALEKSSKNIWCFNIYGLRRLVCELGVWSLIWKTLNIIIKIHWTPRKMVFFHGLFWYGSLPWNTSRNTIPLKYHWFFFGFAELTMMILMMIMGNTRKKRQGSLSIRNRQQSFLLAQESHSWYVYL